LISGHSVRRKDRVDRAFRQTGIARRALVGIDVQHRVAVQELEIGVRRMLVDYVAVLGVAAE